MDAKDYYSRKLRSEIDEHNAMSIGIEHDMILMGQMSKEMKAFISAIFGNDGWIRLVEARWLRSKQHRHVAEYDPKDVVPLYVHSSYSPNVVRVPRQIRDELPTHGSD